MNKINLKPTTKEKITLLHKTLKKGALITYPTDTIYGIGVDIYNENAVQKLFQLKGRKFDKPVSLLYSSVDKLLVDFSDISKLQRRFIQEFMPGPITIILPINPHSTIPLTFIKNGCVGVRVIDLPELNNLLSDYPNPITTTSINPAGLKPANNITEILNYFSEDIDLHIENNVTINSIPSTVIKVDKLDYSVIRESAITENQIIQRIQNI